MKRFHLLLNVITMLIIVTAIWLPGLERKVIQ